MVLTNPHHARLENSNYIGYLTFMIGNLTSMSYIQFPYRGLKQVLLFHLKIKKPRWSSLMFCMKFPSSLFLECLYAYCWALLKGTSYPVIMTTHQRNNPQCIVNMKKQFNIKIFKALKFFYYKNKIFYCNLEYELISLFSHEDCACHEIYTWCVILNARIWNTYYNLNTSIAIL